MRGNVYVQAMANDDGETVPFMQLKFRELKSGVFYFLYSN